MIKYIHTKNKSPYDSDLILCADSNENTPSYNPYSTFKFQWYLTKEKNRPGIPLRFQEYDILILSTEEIKRKNYNGLYLYCILTDVRTKQEQTTESIKLYSDINKVIEFNSSFIKL
ncbi:hypothetical protein MKX83_24060 [Cytobacillus sp. FSL M8-0252]|uniref:hypothetical protein n=1 Tax=Cytobacillus sp. FSL M8-0252 TaxID=2921621 RepID=UPI0030F7B085